MITANDIERVLVEGQNAAMLAVSPDQIDCSYPYGSWERAVFYEGVNRQIASWLISEYRGAHQQYSLVVSKSKEFYLELQELLRQ